MFTVSYLGVRYSGMKSSVPIILDKQYTVEEFIYRLIAIDSNTKGRIFIHSIHTISVGEDFNYSDGYQESKVYQKYKKNIVLIAFACVNDITTDYLISVKIGFIDRVLKNLNSIVSSICKIINKIIH